MSTYTDTTAALGVAIATKTPVILWGDPGQGKTSVLMQIANDYERDIETVLASIREPSDFAGLPTIVDGQTKLIAPDWAQRIAKNGNGILFFDEISTAPPATQAAMLRVALDRVAGDLYLGDEVSIVAAANPPEQAADGWDMALPMSNRFVHLSWSLPAEVVRDGFALGFSPVPIPTASTKAVQEATQEARLLVGAFLGARPDHVTRIPTTTNSEDSRAYPTPRSWEMAATLYGYATAARVSKAARRLLLVGVVGPASAGEFITYIDELDLPNPEDVLKDTDSWEVPTRGDRVYAVGVSVLAAIQGNMTDERWVQTGRVIAAISKAHHADVAVAIGRKWMELRPESGVMPDPESLRTLTPVLRAANLVP